MNANLSIDDIAVGTMKMIKVDGHRVCLVRTADGLHAIDHACPHEGYGLTQGELDGDLVTCAWHNWKFRVTDGACVQGEEAVQTHQVAVADDGAVQVTINRPDPAERRPQLLASLRRGIERNYTGQVARDVVRLLQADANPGELIWEAIAHGAPRAEFGWGHSIASATDCLAMIDLYEGDQRALPIVQGIMGIAESERGRPVNPLPDPATVEASTARRFGQRSRQSRPRRRRRSCSRAIERGDGADDLRPWFSAVVSDHHLSYGHGAIYTQKAFELLEMIGWERARDRAAAPRADARVRHSRGQVAVHAPVHEGARRRRSRGARRGAPVDGWTDDGTTARRVARRRRTAPVDATVAALRAGASVDDVLDVVVRAVSERMLRYDVGGRVRLRRRLRLARHHPWPHLRQRRPVASPSGDRAGERDVAGPDAARAVHGIPRAVDRPPRVAHERRRARRGRAAGCRPGRRYGDELQRQSLLDGTTAFIVHAHAVKTSRAAAIEAARSGSTLPLDAAARFLAAPKLERFVAATVTRSIDFLNGRTQRP